MPWDTPRKSLEVFNFILLVKSRIEGWARRVTKGPTLFLTARLK